MIQSKPSVGLAVALAMLVGLAPLQASALAAPSTPNAEISPNVPTLLNASPVEAQTPIVAPLTEDTARDLIHVQMNPIPLASKLNKSFQGYRVTVASDYPNTLKIHSANINNGQPGTTAYSMVESSLAPAFLSLLLGGGGLLLIGVPIMVVKSSRNSKARQESLQFSNQVPLGDLASDDSFTFNALVPFGQQPDVFLTFKDRQTGLTFNKRGN
ncbi:MAG: hypothetical protein QE263_00585 [Vampirovibrionales bacterium]|nr:hypothetical protein [Vampirovibrionales bacterium]